MKKLAYKAPAINIEEVEMEQLLTVVSALTGTNVSDLTISDTDFDGEIRSRSDFWE